MAKNIDELKLYVKEIPSCDKCPFNSINVTKILNKKPFCILKSQLVSAQFGGLNVSDYERYKCPLNKIEDNLFVEIDGSKYPIKCR